MRTFNTMLKTEIKLSLRGMGMFIFAICAPLAVLIILGIIYGDKPAYYGAEYSFLEQSFSALSTISVCAGGVMGLPLVVSDYRSRGILKRYQVTPVRPSMILAVQVAIYTLYSVVSLVLLYLAAKIFFGYQFRGSISGFLGGYLLVMILSGATLPYEIMPPALKQVADNVLTPICIMGAIAVVCIIVSVTRFKWE